MRVECETIHLIYLSAQPHSESDAVDSLVILSFVLAYRSTPLNMQLVSQEDRNTLVKALRKIEDKREQSLGFHKTKIVTFATCRFKTNTPRWFQLKREMSDPRLDGMMAVGIVLRLIEIDEPFCRCCYEQTEAAMYSDIRNSGFYVGTCDVKPFANMRLAPAGEAFDYMDDFMKNLRYLRCDEHSYKPDRARLGTYVAFVTYEFRDLTIRTEYHLQTVNFGGERYNHLDPRNDLIPVMTTIKKSGLKHSFVRENDSSWKNDGGYFTNTKRWVSLFKVLCNLSGKMGCHIRFHLTETDSSCCDECFDKTWNYLCYCICDSKVLSKSTLYVDIDAAWLEYLDYHLNNLHVVRCARHERLAGSHLIRDTFIATVNYEFADLSLEVFYYKTSEVRKMPTLKIL